MGKAWDSMRPAVSGRDDLRGATKGERDAGGEFGKRIGISYGVPKKNPRCKRCYKLQHDHPKSKCKCESPDWDVRGSEYGYAMQQWHEAWGREALRVTKPGGYLLAFGGTRTHHRLVCGLEDAGWIIRDELTWVYASGFPKGKANLKPAHEPIVLARKPGPLRPLAIDACRIGTTNDDEGRPNRFIGTATRTAYNAADDGSLAAGVPITPQGRWPSNLLLSDPELFDQPNPYVVGSGAVARPGEFADNAKAALDSPVYGKGWPDKLNRGRVVLDGGGYSRFFTIPQGGIICEWCGVSIAGPSFDQPSPPGASALSDAATSADGMPASTGNGDSATTTAPTGNGYSPAASRFTPSTPSEPQPATSPRSESFSSPANGAAQSATSSGTTTTTPSRWLCGSCAVDVTALSTLGVTLDGIGDSPAARGIYPSLLVVPKADRGDREPVLRGQLPLGDRVLNSGSSGRTMIDGEWVETHSEPRKRENAHPTVKPTDLMRHLVRLVTPTGGTVLDCFLGSGSTAIAAELEGFAWIGIEQDASYVAIAEARLNGTQRGLGLDVPAPTKRRTITEGNWTDPAIGSPSWGGGPFSKSKPSWRKRQDPPEEAA